MAFPLAAIVGLLPSVINLVKPLIAGKVKTAVVEKETGTVAVVAKPWYLSKAMLGAAAVAVGLGSRVFGYELGAEGVDSIVDAIGIILIVWGRAKAVK
jgi:hypothetical protein